jgi:hypothetical protein
MSYLCRSHSHAAARREVDTATSTLIVISRRGRIVQPHRVGDARPAMSLASRDTKRSASCRAGEPPITLDPAPRSSPASRVPDSGLAHEAATTWLRSTASVPGLLCATIQTEKR